MRAREKVVRWHSPLYIGSTQTFERACVHLTGKLSLDSLIQSGAGRPFHFTGISFRIVCRRTPTPALKTKTMRCSIIKSMEWIKTFPAHVRPQLNFLLVWKQEWSLCKNEQTQQRYIYNILLFCISLSDASQECYASGDSMRLCHNCKPETHAGQEPSVRKVTITVVRIR